MSGEYFDALETRAPAAREAALMDALPRLIAHAQQHSRALAHILAGVDAQKVTTREALARLPVTRKSELLERQRATRAMGQDAFGGFATTAYGARMQRVFASPGPIYEPEGVAPDYWRTGRALYAAGFRAGDLAHNAFSYHMTPGAFIMESGARAVGCTVFPAGTGQTEQQLQAIAELRPHGYTGTPSFLRILLEKAAEAHSDVSSLTKAMVSGEACPPSLGDVVPEGEVGEVVVTVLNPDYPLVRFGTGDLSAVLPGACPTGRTNTRIKGWLGRADQTTKVRGMFVHPGQVAEIVRRCPEVARARLVVSGEMADDRMLLRAESALSGGAGEAASAALSQRLAEAIRDVTKLRGDVELVPTGSLPNDGKVIEDARSYQ